ncbi:MAG: PAS domain-containing protein [Nitrospirota bacterium]
MDISAAHKKTPPGRISPLKISLIYALAGCLWILCSDRALVALFSDQHTFVRMQTYKGWFFIISTAAVLYWYIRRQVSLHQQAHKTLVSTLHDLEHEKSRFEAIVAAMGEGISIQDRDFRVLYQNQRHKDIVGGDRAGEYCYQAYQRRDQVCPGCHVALSFQDGKVHRAEQKRFTEQGMVHYEIIASPLMDRSGNVIAGIEMVRDITARMKAEEALRASEKNYRDLVDNALVGIYRTSLSGELLYANEAMATMFEFPSPEALQAEGVLMRYRNPSDRAVVLQRLRDHGSLQDFELDLLTRTGQTRHVLLSGSLEGGIISGMILDITDSRKVAEMNRDILQAVDEAFIVIDRDFRVVSANHAYADQVRMPVDAIIGKHCYEISHKIQKPCYEAGEECAVKQAYETGASHAALHTHRDSAGNYVYVETKSFPMKDSNGNVVSVIETINNITAKRNLEDQLRHALKMEAVGTLTGGIAHDFNNILTAILGYTSILKMQAREGRQSPEIIENLLAAANRAASLTKSLLTFSRKQKIENRPFNLNDTVRSMEKLLLRVIGEDIELVTMLADGEQRVLGDTGQIEQVLMNLCTNARDAMTDGGILTISTMRQELDRDRAQTLGLKEQGSYIVLSISDTGMGMDDDTRGKIFDPFFTTKEVGKGTGLGLSIVYGIVKQHQGNIIVTSTRGKGTTFTIYFPEIEASISEQRAPMAAALARGSETILLAEDSKEVRDLTRDALVAAGYTVIEAVDGEDALEKYIANRAEIGMLILDVIMPKKNGKAVHGEIRQMAPDIKVLFISGYTADYLGRKGVIDSSTTLLSKPFLPEDLLRKVDEVLHMTGAN